MKDHVLHYDWNMEFPNLTYGEGVYVYDVNGKKIMDGSSGAISSSLGHGRKDMAETIKNQTEKIAYALRHVSTTPVLQEATNKIFKVTGMDRVFTVSGGTEANEIATKIARLHWLYKGKPTKNRILSRWQSYHGYSTDALSWAGNIARRREFITYLRDDGHIAPPYCYRCWYGKECGKCNFECANALETEILCYGADNIAAFICETIVGASLAAVTPPDGYYQRIREICNKYNVLLILDEVMCGCGRTGKMLAIEHYGVKADIVTLAKSLGGGYYPVGAATCTEEVVEPLKESGHFSPGYTWAGNPVAAAVISKTLDIIRDENLIENVVKMGNLLKEGLINLADKHPTMGDIRGKGLMIGVEFVKDKETKECFDPSIDFAHKFTHNALGAGLLVNPGSKYDMGQRGDGTLVGPCFEVKKEEIEAFIDMFDKALSVTEREVGFYLRHMV